MSAERSYEPIADDDLKRLVQLVLNKLKEIFARAKVASLYQDRLLALTLCQGAAQHYIDKRNGVKDIDVWAFFKAGPGQPFPVRTHWSADFGTSHLGRGEKDPSFVGRRIDIVGRSIPIDENETVEAAIRRWLERGSGSPWYISQCPVIGLHPSSLFGRKIWMPVAAST